MNCPTQWLQRLWERVWVWRFCEKGRKKSLEVKIAELKDDKEALVVTEAKPRFGMTVEDLTPELAKNFGLSDAKGSWLFRWRTALLRLKQG